MTRGYETIDGEKMVSYQRVVIELNAQIACGAIKKEVALDILEHLPVLNPVSTPEIPNKCGKWIREKKHHKDDFQEFDYWDVRCSECGARKRIGWTNVRHCPMCGVKMESEETE